MEPNVRETLRYLGIKGEADPRTLDLVLGCWAQLLEACTPRSTYKVFPLCVEGKQIHTAFTTQSEGLAKNLRGCGQIVLFAATLGAGADRLIQRFSASEISRAAVLQAAAAAMIEDFCDARQDMVRMEMRGYKLRPRFSPGYGDFSLSCQIDLTRILDTPKSIGLTLTESLILAPSKSVTAVIGLASEDSADVPHGCGACSLKDCAYKRLP